MYRFEGGGWSFFFFFFFSSSFESITTSTNFSFSHRAGGVFSSGTHAPIFRLINDRHFFSLFFLSSFATLERRRFQTARIIAPQRLSGMFIATRIAPIKIVPFTRYWPFPSITVLRPNCRRRTGESSITGRGSPRIYESRARVAIIVFHGY